MPQTRITYKYSSSSFSGSIKYITYPSGSDFYVESIEDTTPNSLSSELPIIQGGVYSYIFFILTSCNYEVNLDAVYPSTETLIRLNCGDGDIVSPNNLVYGYENLIYGNEQLTY